MRRALSATVAVVGSVIVQVSVDRVRPLLRFVFALQMARAAAPRERVEPWCGAAEPASGPLPAVAPPEPAEHVPPEPEPVSAGAGPSPVPESEALVDPAAVPSSVRLRIAPSGPA